MSGLLLGAFCKRFTSSELEFFHFPSSTPLSWRGFILFYFLINSYPHTCNTSFRHDEEDKRPTPFLNCSWPFLSHGVAINLHLSLLNCFEANLLLIFFLFCLPGFVIWKVILISPSQQEKNGIRQQKTLFWTSWPGLLFVHQKSRLVRRYIPLFWSCQVYSKIVDMTTWI